MIVFPGAKLLNKKNLFVGSNVVLADAFIDSTAKVEIQNNVFFGHQAMVLTASHDFRKKGTERQKAVNAKPILIKEGAWIASRAIILSGVTIGENSVVGAGAVVAKDVPANSVVVSESKFKIIK